MALRNSVSRVSVTLFLMFPSEEGVMWFGMADSGQKIREPETHLWFVL